MVEVPSTKLPTSQKRLPMSGYKIKESHPYLHLGSCFLRAFFYSESYHIQIFFKQINLIHRWDLNMTEILPTGCDTTTGFFLLFRVLSYTYKYFFKQINLIDRWDLNRNSTNRM